MYLKLRSRNVNVLEKMKASLQPIFDKLNTEKSIIELPLHDVDVYLKNIDSAWYIPTNSIIIDPDYFLNNDGIGAEEKFQLISMACQNYNSINELPKKENYFKILYPEDYQKFNDRQNLLIAVEEFNKKLDARFHDVKDATIDCTAEKSYCWFSRGNTIMIDLPLFNLLTPQEQLATIAHECGHHFENNKFGTYFLNKYGRSNLQMLMVYNEALADFIAQDEFEINIIEVVRRDQERIEDIKHIENVIRDINTSCAKSGGAI